MKTRIITAVVGIVVLIGVLFTFDTLIFNLVITAITLIALHEIYAALGFEKQGWPLLGVLVPYTFLVMLSSYELYRRLVMPASFLVVLFYAIYLVVRNGTISYQKASGLAMFSGKATASESRNCSETGRKQGSHTSENIRLRPSSLLQVCPRWPRPAVCRSAQIASPCP